MTKTDKILFIQKRGDKIRGEASFGSADLSAEPRQGRKENVDRRKTFSFRRGGSS